MKQKKRTGFQLPLHRSNQDASAAGEPGFFRERLKRLLGKLPFFQKKQVDQKQAVPHKRPKRRLKKRHVAAVAIVILGSAAFGIHTLRPKDDDTAQTYTEQSAGRQTIQRTLSSSGTLEPANQYSVTAAVQGEVLSCTFEEGDSVEKGQTLYEIDKTDMENSISRAQLSLQKSQNSYNQTLESLDDLNIKSEDNGVVVELYVEVGDQVQNGTKIADIRDSSTMELRIPFPSDDAASFWIGESATVTMDGSFETLNATVSAIDAVDTVLDGYQIVRYVTLNVKNPGGLSTSSAATATISGKACTTGGTFDYLSESSITAETSGKIASLNIREGSAVTDGMTVATLSSTSIQNSVSDSRLSLQDAQLSYQNTVDQLDDYTITAPISGTVVTKNIKVGDNLDATNGQTELAVIYDLSYLSFDMSLDELDVSEVAVGQEVNITCDALEGTQISGEITKVSVAGTTSNGVTTYPVTVQIANPPDGLLPGMNVDATIVVDEAEDVIAVPVAAVQRGNVVYIKDSSAKNTENIMVGGQTLPDGWREVKVETGLSDDSYIEVTSGLSEDDIVYVPQIVRESSDQNSMMPGGDNMGGGMPGGMPGGGGGMPSGSRGGGGMPGGGGGMP